MSRDGDLVRHLLPLPATDPEGYLVAAAHDLDQFDDVTALDRAVTMLATDRGVTEDVIRVYLGARP